MRGVSELHLCARTIPGFLQVPPEHFTFHDVGALFGDNFFDYIFSIVRNPYHRLESEYRMRKMAAQENSKELPKFSYWLEQIMMNIKGNKQMFANHFRPQIEFMGKSVNVFRYEHGLNKIIEKVGEATGLSFELPKQKFLETQTSHIQTPWSSEAVRMVNDYYAEDFKAFGYEMRKVEFISQDL